jgi:hypothetical protein
MAQELSTPECRGTSHVVAQDRNTPPGIQAELFCAYGPGAYQFDTGLLIGWWIFLSSGLNPADALRLVFAYNVLMGFGIQERKLFVVGCKRCRRNVAAGVKQFPFQSIVACCPLCGERRQYRLSDLFLGRQDQLVAKQTRRP